MTCSVPTLTADQHHTVVGSDREALYRTNRAAFLWACAQSGLGQVERDALVAVVLVDPFPHFDTQTRLSALSRCEDLDSIQLGRLAGHPALDLAGCGVLLGHRSANREVALRIAQRIYTSRSGVRIVSVRILARLVRDDLAATLERAAVLQDHCGPLRFSELDELEALLAPYGLVGIALVERLGGNWVGSHEALAESVRDILAGRAA